jgi:hypothetical protein
VRVERSVGESEGRGLEERSRGSRHEGVRVSEEDTWSAEGAMQTYIRRREDALNQVELVGDDGGVDCSAPGRLILILCRLVLDHTRRLCRSLSGVRLLRESHF